MFLDDFYRVCNDTVLPDGKKVFVRTLSDTEIQARGEYSIMQQLIIQDQLRDTESALYRLKVLPLLASSDEDIIESLAEIRRADLLQEATEQFPLDFFPYPESPTEEEKLETLKRQREHEESVYAARAKYVIDNDRVYREKLAALSHDILLNSIKNISTRVFVIRAQIEAEVHFTIATAFNNLDGTPLWSVNQVKNFSGNVINRLMQEYREVDKIDPWELTKSLQAGDAGGVESSH